MAGFAAHPPDFADAWQRDVIVCVSLFNGISMVAAHALLSRGATPLNPLPAPLEGEG